MKTIKLTKKEKAIIDGLDVCNKACKKIIEEVVKHFEANELSFKAFWIALDEKYKLNIKEQMWILDKEGLTNHGPTGEFIAKQKLDQFDHIKKAVKNKMK